MKIKFNSIFNKLSVLEQFKFWEFGIIDFIDVFLVAILLYYVYKLVKGTVAVNIFIGIIVIYLVWRLTDYLQMDMMHRILMDL